MAENINDPFGLADYKTQNKINNPFVPGSSEYKQFEEKLRDSIKETAGMPGYPDYMSSRDENTGRLQDQFRYDPAQASFYDQNLFSGANADPRALEGLRTEALRGPGQLSQGSQLALDQQKMDQLAGLDQAASSTAGATNQALSNLSMTGGLSGGARERLASQGADAAAEAKQNVRRGGSNQRLGIRMGDEANRLSSLGALSGQELGYAGFEADKSKFLGGQKQAQGLANQQMQQDASKFEAQAGLQDLLGKNAANYGKYAEQMKLFSAGKQSDAGGGGKK